MNILEKVIVALSGEFKEEPLPYGWFHLLWLGLMTLSIIAICIWGRKLNDKQFRIILIVVSVSLILFEIYKQLQFSYEPDGDVWEYGWYYFPFQFCSTPMYIMLLAGLTKGKFQEYLCSFLATFAVIGGLITMFYPATVFVPTIGICIQTMYWHSSLIVIGVLIWVNKRAKLQHRTVFKALAVFLVVVTIAQVLNVIYHYFGDINYSFNMFYVSPFENSGLPVLGLLYDVLPFALYFPAYIIGFTICAYIIVLVALLINKLATRNRRILKSN